MNNRSPATATTKEKPSIMPMRSSLLQRKCACGNSAGMAGECSDCQKKSLVQRQGIDRDNTSKSPPIAHEFPIQTKLTVGKASDIYEQEADRVASQVMSMGNSSPSIQPATAMRKKEVQTKRSSDGESPAGSNIESRLNSSKSGGSPLSDDVRSFMEPRFGADFSQVRVHTGGEAIQMNRELNAQAFTHQQDVYFGAGKTPANDGLTAHELTHVVQQTGGDQVSARVQRAIGDGHDLSSPCFQGDPILEACFDGEQNKYLRSGSSGDAVLKVQQALIALGNPRYALTKDGADSKFGSETATAVSNFKIDNGIMPSDGVVGQKTIVTLDAACVPNPLPQPTDTCGGNIFNPADISQEQDALPEVLPPIMRTMTAPELLEFAKAKQPLGEFIPTNPPLGLTRPIINESDFQKPVSVSTLPIPGLDCFKCIAEWDLPIPSVEIIIATGDFSDEPKRFFVEQESNASGCPTGPLPDLKEVRKVILPTSLPKTIEAELEHWSDFKLSVQIAGGRYLANIRRLTPGRSHLVAQDRQACEEKVERFLSRTNFDFFISLKKYGQSFGEDLVKLYGSNTKKRDLTSHFGRTTPPKEKAPFLPNIDTAKNPFGCRAYWRKFDENSSPDIPGLPSADIIIEKEHDLPPKNSWHVL